MNNEPLGVSVQDAAFLIGVSSPTIWRKIKAGDLAAYKVGSRTLVRMESIRRLVDGPEAA